MNIILNKICNRENINSVHSKLNPPKIISGYIHVVAEYEGRIYGRVPALCHNNNNNNMLRNR